MQKGTGIGTIEAAPNFRSLLGWERPGALRPVFSRAFDLENIMIRLVTAENEHHYRDEMDQALRLRQRVLVQKQRWRAFAKPEARGIDQVDHKHAVHMLYMNGGKVLGYQRMVPTTRQHLLCEVSPELCRVEPPVGAHIWEVSRQCVEPDHQSPGEVECEITNALWSGLVECGLQRGISNFIAEIEPMSLMSAIGLNFQPLPLGLPCQIDGQELMAVMLGFDQRTLDRIYEKGWTVGEFWPSPGAPNGSTPESLSEKRLVLGLSRHARFKNGSRSSGSGNHAL